MNRAVASELLDDLPAEDPRAVRSRRDLRRLNRWMGNARMLAVALHSALAGQTPARLVELGAGDGTFLLSAVRRLGGGRNGAAVVLVDRLGRLVRTETCRGFARLGWHAEAVQADVFEWLQQPPTPPCDALVANLFLHHFPKAPLGELLLRAAQCAPVFIAVEPRRCRLALVFSRLLWLMGCSAVTRHDAPVSVRAGFRGRELSELWPIATGWRLEERAVGRFGHLFIARRGNGG